MPNSKVCLKVKSLKGQVYDLEADVMDTVRDVKYAISCRMNGLRVSVDEMRLIYKAKPMSDEEKTLASFGIPPSLVPVNIHLVTRFIGGGSAVQEIASQLKTVIRSHLHGVELIEAEDEFTWNIMMRGPQKSPYSEGLFSLTFNFPQDYPYSPPFIKFNTPIFHPNVYDDGRLCWADLDSTGSKYCADILIGAVNCLLEQPNPDNPADDKAAKLYSCNRSEYNTQARAHTKMHAGFK